MFVFEFVGVAGNVERLEIPLPLFFAVMTTLVEFFGGMALILGLYTRLAPIPLALNTVVASLLVHLPNGFFSMNSGYDHTLVLLAASVALAVAGPGEAALGRNILARGNSKLAWLAC